MEADLTHADFFLWGQLKGKVEKYTRIQVCLDVKGEQFQRRL